MIPEGGKGMIGERGNTGGREGKRQLFGCGKSTPYTICTISIVGGGGGSEEFAEIE